MHGKFPVFQQEELSTVPAQSTWNPIHACTGRQRTGVDFWAKYLQKRLKCVVWKWVFLGNLQLPIWITWRSWNGFGFPWKIHVFNHKAIPGRWGGQESGFAMEAEQSKPAKMNQTFFVAFLAWKTILNLIWFSNPCIATCWSSLAGNYSSFSKRNIIWSLL